MEFHFIPPLKHLIFGHPSNFWTWQGVLAEHTKFQVVWWPNGFKKKSFFEIGVWPNSLSGWLLWSEIRENWLSYLA